MNNLASLEFSEFLKCTSPHQGLDRMKRKDTMSGFPKTHTESLTNHMYQHLRRKVKHGHLTRVRKHPRGYTPEDSTTLSTADLLESTAHGTSPVEDGITLLRSDVGLNTPTRTIGPRRDDSVHV